MKYKDWYGNKVVQFEILKQCKFKEVVFLGDKRVRLITLKTIYDFMLNMKTYGFPDAKNNIYHSFANFHNLGYFSFNPEVRRKQMDRFNSKEAEEVAFSYDLGIDFDDHDSNNFDKMKGETKDLKNIFDEYSIPYSIKCSGSGFHFQVEHKNLPSKIITERDIEKKIHLIKTLVNDITFLLDLKTLDSGRDKEGNPNGSFYSLRRIWKVAYSWDYKTNRIALPLTDFQFNNFNFGLCDPDYILKNIKIYNRGLLYRKGSSKDFDKFVKEVLGWQIV